MNVKGFLTIKELAEKVETESIETVIVAFTDHYGRMMGKRFDAEFFLDSAVEDGTHSCNYLLTTDMEMEPVKGFKFANWELGYGDFHLVPDILTLRTADWLERTAIVFCDIVNEKSHELESIAPRSILRNQINAAADLGYVTKSASELEYYLFENSYREANTYISRYYCQV